MPAIPAPDRAAVAGDAELRKPFHEGVLQRRKPRHHRNKGVAHFVERWEADDILLALLRTAATHPGAAERMRTIWSTQPVPALAVLGARPQASATPVALINALFLGFAYSRYILELQPLVSMSRAEIVRWLGPVVQRYLFGKA
jgi:hypothetical protein